MFCAGYAVYMWSLVDGWSQLYILKCDELILSIGKLLVAFFFVLLWRTLNTCDTYSVNMLFCKGPHAACQVVLDTCWSTQIDKKGIFYLYSL